MICQQIAAEHPVNQKTAVLDLNTFDATQLTLLEVLDMAEAVGVEPEALGAMIADSSNTSKRMRTMYALAWVIAKRANDYITFAEVCTWKLDVIGEVKPEKAEASKKRAAIVVGAASVSGLPPSEAGKLTLAEIGAYKDRQTRESCSKAKALMAGVSLSVNITGDTKGLSNALGGAGGEVKDFGSSALGTAAKVSVVAGAALAAGAAIMAMTKAAAEDRDEQNKLALAVQKAGAETAVSNNQIDEAIRLGQEKAFTDSESREALTSLVTATEDVGSATQLLTHAQDIARFAGVDLATAADAVAKAHAG